MLRRVVRAQVQDLWPRASGELGVILVGSAEITRLNESFLRHAGATDVIAFSYLERTARNPPRALQGEVFVCVDEALAQAHRYRTTWPVELVRYVVHGLLHLRGFRDGTPVARGRMKREENRRLRALARTFALSQVAASR